jgi:hypothetical protein
VTYNTININLALIITSPAFSLGNNVSKIIHFDPNYILLFNLTHNICKPLRKVAKCDFVASCLYAFPSAFALKTSVPAGWVVTTYWELLIKIKRNLAKSDQIKSNCRRSSTQICNNILLTFY